VQQVEEGLVGEEVRELGLRLYHFYEQVVQHLEPVEAVRSLVHFLIQELKRDHNHLSATHVRAVVGEDGEEVRKRLHVLLEVVDLRNQLAELLDFRVFEGDLAHDLQELRVDDHLDFIVQSQELLHDDLEVLLKVVLRQSEQDLAHDYSSV
jgi:hypothetical protein